MAGRCFAAPGTKVMLSRCPNCETTFNVSPAQLEAADGLVRCGNCMATFSAPQHQIDSQDTGPGPAPASSDDALASDSHSGVTENWLAQLLPGAEANERELADNAPAAPGPASQSGRIEPSLQSYPRVDLLQRISPEPIALNPSRAFSALPLARSVVGLICCGLLLALLAFQWWARYPAQWPTLSNNPVVAWSCRYYPCRLQANYQSEQLAVYSHPEQRGLLIVEAVLSNNSAVDQPYPLLALQFTDLDNRPVAQRQFAPGEYLRGEASGARHMPPATPIRIALTIQDPGPDAVNYTLQLFPRGGRS